MCAEIPAIRLALATVMLVCTAAVVEANEMGPLSGSARTGCGNGCHGDAKNPSITLEAPSVTDEVPKALAVHFSVADALVGGGGFMLEASAGRLDVAPDMGMRNSTPAEISHDGTRPLDRSWSATWSLDGPVTGCTVDLRLAAMATNGARDDKGDSWGVVSSQIAVVPVADDTAPSSPTFFRPVAGSIINAGSRVGTAAAPITIVVQWVEFRIRASDATGVRDVVLFDSDATGVETAIGAATFDPKTGDWVRRWSTAGVTPGPHKTRAAATDCAGNVSEATMDVVAF